MIVCDKLKLILIASNDLNNCSENVFINLESSKHVDYRYTETLNIKLSI